MNKISKILTILIILSGIIFLDGCVKEKFKAPAFVAPHVTFQANTSIAALRANLPVTTAPAGTVIPITGNVIIEGIVVADDRGGNYYEEIVIQDTSAGIEVLLNGSDLYTKYPVGQRVFIKCQGLYLGNYGYALQIGLCNNKTIEKIPPVDFDTYIFPDSLPGNPPAPISFSLISAISAKYVDMLVQFNTVHFNAPEVGELFAYQSVNNTSHQLIDKASSGSLTVYTSKYADFSADKVPGGKGNIIGILTYYKGYELYVRTINDVIPTSGWIFQ